MKHISSLATLAISSVLGFSVAAKATTVCALTTESDGYNYNKLIAQEIFEESSELETTHILKDADGNPVNVNGVQFGFGKNTDSSLWVTAFSLQNQKFVASALSIHGSSVSLLLGRENLAFSCTVLK